jgi:hypothetical protein
LRTAAGPVLALLAMYIVLTPRGHKRWLACFAFLWLVALTVSVHALTFEWHGSRMAPLLVPLATVALLPLCKQQVPSTERRFRFAYTLMLFSFLAVAAPAPSAVLFDDSLDEATTSFMRWTQRESLRALSACKLRSTGPNETPERIGYYPDLFEDAAAKAEANLSDGSRQGPVARWLENRPLKAHLAAGLFSRIPVRSDAIPGYNQMVMLAADDQSWRWSSWGTRGGTMEIDEAGDNSSAPSAVRGRAPSFFTAAGWEFWVLGLLTIVAFAVNTFFVLGSITRRLFLLDADADGRVHVPEHPAGLRGLYLLRRPPRTLVSSGDTWSESNAVSFDLARQTPGECGRSIDLLDPKENHVVLIDHFDVRLDDAKAARAKLDLLARLDKRDEIAVVLLCDVEPVSFLGASADGTENGASTAASDVSRWADALRSYYTSCVLPGEPASTGACGVLGRPLAEALRRRVREQQEESRGAGRHWRVWNQLTRPEKLALVQLAEEGFLNPKVPEVARSLMQRGLIRRDPVFRIADRGFPEFVKGVESSATVKAWEKEGARSSWAKLRPALMLLLVFGVGFLYSTQRGLFSETVAFATAVTGALPLLLRLFASFGRQPDGGSSEG